MHEHGSLLTRPWEQRDMQYLSTCPPCWGKDAKGAYLLSPSHSLMGVRVLLGGSQEWAHLPRPTGLWRSQPT